MSSPISKPRKKTDITKLVLERFYGSIEALIARGDIKSIASFCEQYGIDRRNFYAQRKDLDRGWFQVSWLHPLVKDFGVNAEWLLTGMGRMFK